MKSNQNLQRVRTYDDLKPQQVVRYRFGLDNEWEFAMVGAISQEALQEGIKVSNSITLNSIYPSGSAKNDYSRTFGPVNPHNPLGRNLYRLEDVDMELVPMEMVKGYKVSYDSKIL